MLETRSFVECPRKLRLWPAGKITKLLLVLFGSRLFKFLHEVLSVAVCIFVGSSVFPRMIFFLIPFNPIFIALC